MESPNQIELQSVSKQRNVFKMNLKNQHLLAFALALLRTDDFDQQTFAQLCAGKGIELTGPVDQQNDAMDALFWKKAKENRKSLNDFVRKTNLRHKKASSATNQEKPVKRKYIRKSKVEAEADTSTETKDEVVGEVRLKRKYTRKPKVVDTLATVVENTDQEIVVENTDPAIVVETTDPAIVVETTDPTIVVETTDPAIVVETTDPAIVVETTDPETDVPKKRKYTRKPKDVRDELVAVEEAVALEEVVALEKLLTEEVRTKRAYNKKPVDQVAQPNPFDKFKVKINKKLEQQTGSVPPVEQKENIRKIVETWLNAENSTRSTQDVLHLIRHHPQYIALLEKDTAVEVGSMTPEVVGNSYLSVSVDETQGSFQVVVL